MLRLTLVFSFLVVAFAIHSSSPEAANRHLLLRTHKRAKMEHFFVPKRVRHSSKYGSGTVEPGVVVGLTPKMLDLLTSDKSRQLLAQKMEGFVAEEFRFNALQLNVSVFKMTLHKFVAPKIKIQPVSPTSFRVVTSGGSADFRGVYKAVYRTVRDGQVLANVDGLRVDVTVQLRRDSGRVAFAARDCAFAADSVTVEINRPLIPLADHLFGELFNEFLKKRICAMTDGYIDRLSDKFAEAIENAPISLWSKNSNFDAKLVREPKLDQHGLHLAFDGSYGSEGDLAGLARKRVQLSTPDGQHMVYMHVSEFVFNSFLAHRDNGEIVALAVAPSHNLYEFGDTVVVRLLEAPKVEFFDYGAKLHLNLRATIKRNDEKRLSVDLRIRAFIERFELNVPLSRANIAKVHKLGAKVSVEDVIVDATITESEELRRVAERLPDLLQQHRPDLEQQLEANLHLLFPLRVNPFLQVSSIHGFFRRHTLVFAFDLRPDELLLRSA